MIRGVYFDAGNTLIFPDYSIYRDVVAELGGAATMDAVIGAEAAARSAFDDAVASSEGRDVMSFWEIYYTPFYERLGLDPERVASAIERTRVANDVEPGIWRVPVEGYRETIDELRGRLDAIGIISNSDGRLERRLEDIGMLPDFDFVVDSAVVGVSKPDRGIFETALERGGLPADQTAYVGDYYAVDVVGARRAGMRPVLFDPVGAYGAVDCDIIRSFPEILDLLDGWKENE